MAIKLGDAILYLAANDKDLTAALNRSEKKVEKFAEKTDRLGDRVGNMYGKSLKNIAAYGVGLFGVTKAVSFVVGEINESQQASQQLNAVLTSTGGIAGVTAGQVNNLGTQLAQMSNFSDDAIISASALMLSFTNVSSNVFPRAMQSAVDLATAMNIDLKGAIIQIGKALNDPVRGMTALSKAGVQFNESQREAIANAIDNKDILSAQLIILEELARQMGGSAAAAADTFAGSVIDLKDALGNLAEELEPVVDLVTRAVNGFTSMARAITSPIETFKLLFNNYDELEADAKKREGFSRSVNKAMRRTQMMEYGANLTTAEGTTREEYDAKYAAEESKVQAAQEAAAKKQAESKAKELTPEQRYNIAARAAYTAYATGEPAQGPQTLAESAQASQAVRGQSGRGSAYGVFRTPEQMNVDAQKIIDMQRAQGISDVNYMGTGNNIIISHANFVAGPDQVRAYNQRRAMMPGVP